jgi:hypothetical protein
MDWSREVLMLTVQGSELHGDNKDDLGNWKTMCRSAHRMNNI